jgi:hypothetical protein
MVLICVLPAQPAVMEPNDLAYNVIAKTPAAEGDSVLAFAGCNTFEFFDVMPATAVVRVLGKDGGGALFLQRRNHDCFFEACWKADRNAK